MKLLVCGTLAFAWLASASHAAEPNRPLAKAGITFATYEADDAQCRQLAKGLNLDTSQGILPTELARGQVHAACMKRAGYVYARLTPKEQRTYRSLIGGDLRVWLDEFLQSSRAEEATRRLAPQLPRHPDGPAFSLIPGGAALSEATRGSDEPVMTVHTKVQALRLKTPFEYDGGKVAVAADAVFVPAIMALRESAIINTWIPVIEPGWCAAATVAKAKIQDKMICLFDDNDGYRVVLSGPNYELHDFALRDIKVLRGERLTTPLDFAKFELEVEVRYDVRSALLARDVAIGVATIEGRDYVVSRTEAGKDGAIDVDLVGGVARLTPSGNAKSITYTAALLEPQESAAVLSERDRLATPCSLNDFVTEGMTRGDARGSWEDRLRFVLAADCVQVAKR